LIQIIGLCTFSTWSSLRIVDSATCRPLAVPDMKIGDTA
jgi:hypothetical protein